MIDRIETTLTSLLSDDQYAAEFAAITENVRLTCQELVAELNAKRQPGAATCVAELSDHLAEVLKAATLLVKVYLP